MVNYNDNIAVVRELDFESGNNFVQEQDIDDNYVRKRVHVFNGNMEIIKSIKLPYFATDIYFKNDSLITLNYEDEKIYIYSIE